MNKKSIYRSVACLSMALIPFFTSCEYDVNNIDTEAIAPSPQVADVFIDGFSAGLEFQAWGYAANLSVDNVIKHGGSSALSISVPDPEDPEGSWAGGTFYTTAGRNLTEYNCLTFYAKASTATSIEVGIGNYGENAQHVISMKNVKVGYNWKKYIIPIPNSSVLTNEQGLFYYAAGAVNHAGYTLWFDDVKFEKIDNLAHTRIRDISMPGFTTGDFKIGTIDCRVNLPNGYFQHLEVSPAYFNFESSDPEVATVENGVITFNGKKGEVVFTPEGVESGTIRITDIYDLAPEPTLPATDVRSVFSDSYTQLGNGIFNNYWEWQTTTSDIIDAGGNKILHYGYLNFVGIVFQNDVDVTNMTHMHMDILLMDKNSTSNIFKVTPHSNSGPIGEEESVELESGKWVTLDMPLNPGITSVHELVLAKGDGCDYQDILIDNIYFYKK